MLRGNDMSARVFTLLWVGLACTSVSLADTVHVPRDANDIQTAIDNAQSGDVIVVAPGTYSGARNRDLHFDGKALTVRGGADDYARLSCDPNTECYWGEFWMYMEESPTVIDCNASVGDPHRAFLIDGSQIIEGFTIRKGLNL